MSSIVKGNKGIHNGFHKYFTRLLQQSDEYGSITSKLILSYKSSYFPNGNSLALRAVSHWHF